MAVVEAPDRIALQWEVGAPYRVGVRRLTFPHLVDISLITFRALVPDGWVWWVDSDSI